jgi:hypothetical protein
VKAAVVLPMTQLFDAGARYNSTIFNGSGFDSNLLYNILIDQNQD